MRNPFRIAPFLILLILASYSYAQEPILDWAKQMDGTGSALGKTIAVDSDGYIYTAGYFYGTIDIDPGIETLNLTAVELNDGFIQKMDPDGNLIWAKQIKGTNYVHVRSIDIDSEGNIYTIGRFKETADFDPGPDINNLTSAGGYDVFILKLSSEGEFIWADRMGGDSQDYGESLNIENEKIYCTGHIEDSVTFNSEDEAAILTSNGWRDIFVLSIDLNGNLVWAKNFGGNDADRGLAITANNTGETFIVGQFRQLVDFDPGPETNNLTAQGEGGDGFILKLDPNGNYLWSAQIGGLETDIAKSVTTDLDENVYIVGGYENTVDFDPGSGVFNVTSEGSSDIFILKLDGNGNYLWSGQIGGPESDIVNSITTDELGKVYVTGSFRETVDFDPGSGTVILDAGNSYKQLFILNLDSEGNFIWAGNAGGFGDMTSASITIDAIGNIYNSGNFESTVDFDMGSGVSELSAGSTPDIFVLKLNQNDPIGMNEVYRKPGTLEYFAYPNPTTGIFSVVFNSIKESISIRITDYLGKVVLYERHQNSKHISIELEQSKGIYILEMTDEKGYVSVSQIVIE